MNCKNPTKRTWALAIATIAPCLAIACQVNAANIPWSGATNTNFETATNWTGGVAPANNATTDVAQFINTPTANQPSLTTSRSVTGVLFGATSGWTLSSASSSNVLTVGTSGVQSQATSGTQLVTANIGINNTGSTTSTTFGAGGSTVGSGVLLLTGSMSGGSSGSPIQAQISVGSSSRRDTVIISPSSGNSVNLYLSTATAGGLATGTAGTLVLGGTGGNATSSSNIISNAILPTTGQAASLRYQSGATLQINSGTWTTNDVGGPNSNTATGILQITGGTLKTAAARYIVNAGGVATMTGGTIQVTGDGFVASNAGCFALGANGTGTATFNLVDGAIDVARARTSSNNAVGGTSTGLFNQSGGTMTFGLTAPTHVFTGASATPGTAGGDVTIGSTNSGVSGAYTLTGGTLTVAGTIKGAIQPGAGVNNFNFKGGTLAARAFDATLLGSNAAATISANQIAASNNIGTLMNYGGTVAPGGVSASGLMSVTGNYAGNGSGSTLAIDISGTTAAAAFAGAAGTFDVIVVSGTTSLNDVLSVNLISGFTPLSTDSFSIVKSTGTLSGAFSNVAFGSRINLPGQGSFLVTQSGNDVVLSNFQPIPEPATLTIVAMLSAMALRRRTLSA